MPFVGLPAAPVLGSAIVYLIFTYKVHNLKNNVVGDSTIGQASLRAGPKALCLGFPEDQNIRNSTCIPGGGHRKIPGYQLVEQVLA